MIKFSTDLFNTLGVIGVLLGSTVTGNRQLADHLLNSLGNLAIKSLLSGSLSLFTLGRAPSLSGLFDLLCWFFSSNNGGCIPTYMADKLLGVRLGLAWVSGHCHQQ
jgi:hypothetical protein